VPILRFKVRSRDAWRARRARAYNGGLGAEPPAGPRGRAPGQGARGAKPPEAESLLAFQRPITARKITSFTVSSKLPWKIIIQIFPPCLLLSSSTGYQTFKHGFQISKHVRACRHVIIGADWYSRSGRPIHAEFEQSTATSSSRQPPRLPPPPRRLPLKVSHIIVSRSYDKLKIILR